MSDLSGLSDTDLIRLYQSAPATPPTPVTDLSKLSDTDLVRLYQQPPASELTPDAQPDDGGPPPLAITVHGNVARPSAPTSPGRDDVLPGPAVTSAPTPAPQAVDDFGRPLDAPNPAPAPDLPSQSAPPSSAPPPSGDSAAAFGHGLADGVPIVGPYLAGGLTNVAAGVRSLQNGTPFADEKKNVEAFNTGLQTDHPIAHGAGEVGGAVLGTAPLMAAAPALFGASTAPMAMRMGASALTSGAMGGADSAARGQNPVVGAATGFGLGAVGPLAAAGAGQLVGAVASKFSPPAAVETVEQLKAAARVAYQRAKDSGVQIAAPAFNGAIADISSAARNAGIDATLHPKAMAVVSRLNSAAGASPTLGDIEILRRVAKGAANSLEPDERRIGKVIIDRLDHFTDNLQPQHLVSGDADAATKALREARDLWGRAKRGELIDTALDRADLRAASTGSGGNVDNASRQEIRKIVTNPKTARGFSPEEIEAMKRYVRGTAVQNATRLVGKLSPVGNGLMTALGIGGAAANPHLAVIPAIGWASKKVADHTAERAAGLLSDIVRSGGTLPTSPLALTVRGGAERVAGHLAAPAPLAASRRLSR